MTDPTASVDRRVAALAAVPTGTYTLRGVVSDWSMGRVWGDSAGGAPRATPLAGATVAVSLVTRTPTTGDTATAGKVLTPFARVTTGADGSFSVPNIAAGYYALDVSAPSGSSDALVRTYADASPPGTPCPIQIALGTAPVGASVGGSVCGGTPVTPSAPLDSIQAWNSCPVAPAGTLGPGAVRGRVSASGPVGVAGWVTGATVRVTLLSTPPADSTSAPAPVPNVTASGTTGDHGAFTIGGLPLGTYRVEVTPPAGRGVGPKTVTSGALRPNDLACTFVTLTAP